MKDDLGVIEFDGYAEVEAYATSNFLEYAWLGSSTFRKQERLLPADEFFVFPARSGKGPTAVGFWRRRSSIAEHREQERLADRRGRLMCDPKSVTYNRGYADWVARGRPPVRVKSAS